jgi:hypothetical protein
MRTERKAEFLSPKALCALALGGLLGSLTLAVPKLSSISENPVVGTAQRSLFALLVPGIIAAGALSGNVHTWSLWIAAGINMIVYSVTGWLACWVVMKLFRRRA